MCCLPRSCDTMQRTNNELKREFISSVSSLYSTQEASAIFYIVAEELWGLKRNDLIVEPCKGCDVSQTEFMVVVDSLNRGVPVQYVTGVCGFCDLNFTVNPSVLIPRPETQELVYWVVDQIGGRKDVLDIGTGSGAIAVSIAKLTDAKVVAVDISDDALVVARENARANSVDVEFVKRDILSDNLGLCVDVVVSNPPYIPILERGDMRSNVVGQEPDIALFVPDDDPLLFYRRIAEVGRDVIRENGLLFFEIHENFGADVVSMLQNLGYKEIVLKQDIHGKDRMVRCLK